VQTIKLATLLASLLTLAACATVTPSFDGKGDSQSAPVRERNYVIGTPRSVVVGDPIVRARDYLETVTETPSMVANETFTFSGGLITIPFRQGEKYEIWGQRTNGGVTYTVVNNQQFWRSSCSRWHLGTWRDQWRSGDGISISRQLTHGAPNTRDRSPSDTSGQRRKLRDSIQRYRRPSDALSVSRIHCVRLGSARLQSGPVISFE
jgi:hypothetical protein